MDTVKIGRYIAGKRKALGLTQKQLAEKLGMSDKSVSKWERGVCMPDISVYTELCEILGISINEFIAGEDISSEDTVKKSEDNIISIASDSSKRQKNLKRIIAVLIVISIFATAAVGMILYRIDRPKNCIYAVGRDSAEMKTAELLSGVDGAFMYRYEASDSFKSLTIYISEYRSGKLINKQHMNQSYEDTGSPKGGMIVIVPDFERFTIKLIAADEGSKFSTDIPILENVKGRKYYGRSASEIKEQTAIKYGEEQGLAAMIYDNDVLSQESIKAFESGTASPENDYVYYFSFKFNK